jgi:nucleoside-diphosphate-sugar epimerase
MKMDGARVTITGGSGFVGQLLRPGLRERGYEVEVFDRFRGPVVNALRREWLGANGGTEVSEAARRARVLRARAERTLLGLGILRPTGDDIFDLRSRLADRFHGSRAVVHLAALPHPNVPGAGPDDFRRINYDGAANVFAATQEAGVPKFIFASSGQVYGINDPVRIDQFPILESNYLPTPEDGQSAYGALKADFERHLAETAPRGETQAVSLRLECPGVLSDSPGNLYTSTSVENTVAGFGRAIEAELDAASDVFNLVDGRIRDEVADIQAFLRERWPDVPNHTRDNESLLSIEKAHRLLGYEPTNNGTYYPLRLIWG